MNMNMNVLKVLKQEGGILPTRAHNTDAGWDLYTPKTFTLMPHEKMCIDIKIAITVPYGTYGRIAPRSGLAYKHGVDVLAGVIDHQYTNNIGVILINHGTTSVEFKEGNRIAQLIITKIELCNLTEVDSLDVDSRGGGFGSTGI